MTLLPHPLQGVKVVDASQGVAGPYGALLLALQGAEVIKVEPPGGDWLRALGRRIGDHSPHSWYLNRAKSCRVIDLSQDAGRSELADLASGADIFIDSLRADAAQRMGLSFAQLAARSPQLVHCRISGFGADGPLASRGAVDGVLQAFSGWMSVNAGADGVPRSFPFYAIDMLAGLYASQAILAAYIRRLRGGPGAPLEISLMQSAAAFLGPRLLEIAQAGGESPALFSSPNGAFRTRDGWFMVAVTTQAHFVSVCRALDREDLARDPRFASRQQRIEHRAALDALLAPQFEALDSADCDRRFAAAGALGAPVMQLAHLLDHPQMRAAGAVGEIEAAGGRWPAALVPGADTGLQQRPAPALAGTEAKI